MALGAIVVLEQGFGCIGIDSFGFRTGLLKRAPCANAQTQP
ncbi:hypothetical protein [Rhodoferax sp.]|nr:hypothetical protein [Rhodoferax sp.]